MCAARQVNARMSRSSALASKATGYPLAFVAAKLGLGISLPYLRNAVTRSTTACFEPALDYCVVKIPRWDLGKFQAVDKRIGSMMKSVGEVMSIGRTFEEAMQKALRMTDSASVMGFEPHGGYGDLREELANPTPRRVYALAEALTRGWSIDQLHDVTRIDRWYLSALARITAMRGSLSVHTLDSLPRDTFYKAKSLGFSDTQMALHLASTAAEARARAAPGATRDVAEALKAMSSDKAAKEALTRASMAVRERRKALGILPVVKQIDTLAAEFPAQTNYLYMTYNGSTHDVSTRDGSRVVILGSGVYRIGSSVEFDYCSVATARALRKKGVGTVLINYNPETVSTDYDESDRLYFEELSLERVLDIYEVEAARGVIVSMGGQEPQNIALPLARAGANVLGTSPDDIDRAEDREKFSALLDRLQIDQPPWCTASSVDAAGKFAAHVGYPVLIRPSYVLSGAAMAVAHTPEHLQHLLTAAASVSAEHPTVVTKFYTGCMELECDAVAAKGELVAVSVVCVCMCARVCVRVHGLTSARACSGPYRSMSRTQACTRATRQWCCRQTQSAPRCADACSTSLARSARRSTSRARSTRSCCTTGRQARCASSRPICVRRARSRLCARHWASTFSAWRPT
jgi:carbamoyl-phosphate synthase large subunit